MLDDTRGERRLLAYPSLGVSAVLTLAPGCSPWRLQAAHGYPARVTDGSGRPEIWRAISAFWSAVPERWVMVLTAPKLSFCA